jgi:hypothetical protein
MARSKWALGEWADPATLFNLIADLRSEPNPFKSPGTRFCASIGPFAPWLTVFGSGPVLASAVASSSESSLHPKPRPEA